MKTSGGVKAEVGAFFLKRRIRLGKQTAMASFRIVVMVSAEQSVTINSPFTVRLQPYSNSIPMDFGVGFLERCNHCLFSAESRPLWNENNGPDGT